MQNFTPIWDLLAFGHTLIRKQQFNHSHDTTNCACFDQQSTQKFRGFHFYLIQVYRIQNLIWRIPYSRNFFQIVFKFWDFDKKISLNRCIIYQSSRDFIPKPRITDKEILTDFFIDNFTRRSKKKCSDIWKCFCRSF